MIKTAKKRIFLTPGPVEIPSKIRKAMLKPVLHHRSREFAELFNAVSTKLQKVFLTKNPVLMLHCAGTGAMESSLACLTETGDKVLVLQNGVFSHRWAEIAQTLDLKTDVLEFSNGKSIDLQILKKVLAQKGRQYKAVLFNHIETSTGALNNICEISKFVKKYSSAFTIADAMASVAAEKLFTDKWGLDIVITSLCKAIAGPAGISFVSVSGRVLKYINKHKSKSFYFDLKKTHSFYKQNQTPFTGSSPLFYAADTALDIILNKGIKTVWCETKKLSRYMRDLCKKNGFEIFPEYPANALTVIKTNKADYIVKQMQKRFNIIIANGQEELKGKIIRTSNMGQTKKSDLTEFFIALNSIAGGGNEKAD